MFGRSLVQVAARGTGAGLRPGVTRCCAALTTASVSTPGGRTRPPLTTSCAGDPVLPVGPCRRSFTTSAEFLDDELRARLQKLIDSDSVVAFIKGTKDEPMCGYSKAVSLIFKVYEVPYTTVNVLEDEEIRQGIKLYSNWNTIPQVFVNGNFIGGCDIMLEMHDGGALNKFWDDENISFKKYFKEKRV